MKTYKFYGHESKDVKPIAKGFERIKNQRHLYDLMSNIWCEYSCAPRMRPDWSENNKTLGQCSITSFLIQDIFGGKVYGVPLPEGGYHCYNIVGDSKFDLTSEQFGDTKLDYSDLYEQSREEHFASKEKLERYLYLKKELMNTLLLQNNEEFVSKQNSKLKELVNGQSPFMMVITCSDSRVVPEHIFNLSFNDLFVIRTAGNVINEGELATVEYGLKHLHIKYVLVLGHRFCGAIKATLNHEQGMYLDPILNRIRHNIKDITNERDACAINAHAEAQYLKEKFPDEDVVFTSGTYDLETNKVIFNK